MYEDPIYCRWLGGCVSLVWLFGGVFDGHLGFFFSLRQRGGMGGGGGNMAFASFEASLIDWRISLYFFLNFVCETIAVHVEFWI